VPPIETVAIGLAGLIAGMVNTIVGSGSLLTFPTLVAFGYPPLVANVSNTVGLVPGVLSGTLGYRRELAGQGARSVRLGAAALAGGVTGAVLLLALPPSAFARIVPFLILVACGLVAFQPRLAAVITRRHVDAASAERSPILLASVYATGIYGGYFGAAQGVILIALLGIFIEDDLQRLNGLKNLLALLINAIAAVLFALVAPVAWGPAFVLAVGSIVGGQLGATVGRRLSPSVLRAAIVLVGLVVAGRLLVS
jgi:hypothetical protein